MWEDGVGDCASFAIYVVASQIDLGEPTTFTFANLKHVHGACYSCDGFMIDSSARDILQGVDGDVLRGCKPF